MKRSILVLVIILVFNIDMALAMEHSSQVTFSLWTREISPRHLYNIRL